MAQRSDPLGPPGYFFEGARWRDGRWWASDMHDRTVFSYSQDGEARIELQLEDDKPSGLGWLPDGAMLVVSMHKRRLLRRAPDSRTFEVFADLAPLFDDTLGFLNDMWVSQDGHVYVGFDADYQKYDPQAGLGMIVHVDPQGRAEIAGRGLNMPNGLVITPDGSTLVVAETLTPRFTSFPIGANGALGPASIWANMEPKVDRRPAGGPALSADTVRLDGCVMDAEGCIWVADPWSACLRVAPGGDIVDAVFLPGDMRSWACALGGDDLKTLMICGADLNFPDRMRRKASQLYVTLVDAPGF